MGRGSPSLATGDAVSTFDQYDIASDGEPDAAVQADKPEAAEAKRENFLERAEKLRLEEERKQQKKQFLQSADGVDLADEELAWLADYLEEQADELTSRALDVRFSERRSSEHVYCLSAFDASFTLGWQLQWANSLEYSSLFLREFDGRYSFHGLPKRNDLTFEQAFYFDLNAERDPVWVPGKGENQYSTRELADRCLKRLIERHYARREARRPDLQPV